MNKNIDDLNWSKSFMYALHQTYFLAEKRLESRLRDIHGITFSQFLILLGLHCTGKSSQNAIASFLFITEATVSRHVSVLEKAKYLTRKADATNRRRHILEMTMLGKKVFTTAHEIIQSELEDIFSCIQHKDRSRITKSFEGVIDKLKNKHK